MNESKRKSTGIYRCPDNVANFILRLELKEVVDETTEAKEIETRVFRWQEKHFAKFEKDFYTNDKNCITDLDKKYHEKVANLGENDNVLYTYVDDDRFSPHEEICSSANVNAWKAIQIVDGKDYDFIDHFCKAVEGAFCDDDYVCMYIMADFGEYVGDTWIKSEHILCSLKYDPKKKLLLTHPDFSTIQSYGLEIENDTKKKYQYTLENVSEGIDQDLCAQENEILNTIIQHQLKQKAREIGNDFETPLKDKLHVHLFFEILTAKSFEYDDIYVQYFIDLPDNWTCRDAVPLKGVTQSCRTRTDENVAHFGFPFDVLLEYNLQNLDTKGVPRAPYVYFEVISKDTFDRFRTEGLTYKNLPVGKPGIYNYKLPCLRILPKCPYSNMRRFFIGDYLSYNDVTWIGVPKNYQGDVINKHGVDTVGTGEIEVKISVVHQSQAFLDDGGNIQEKYISERLSCSTLVKSVEQVLKAFKRARKNMIEARKHV